MRVMMPFRRSAIVGIVLPVVFAVAGGLFAVPPEPVQAESTGVIFVVDQDCCNPPSTSGGLIRVDLNKPAGADQTIVSSATGGNLFVDPVAAAIGIDGALYVVDLACCGGIGSVIRVDLTQAPGSNGTTVSVGQFFARPSDIVVAPDGKLYVVDYTCCAGANGGIIRVDPSLPNDNNQTVIASGGNFASPVRVTVAADGSLYVVDAQCCAGNQGAVIKVNPANGSQTVISEGQFFSQPFAVSLGFPGFLFVVDLSCCSGGKGGLIEVDLSKAKDSNQNLVSQGQHFAEPLGLVMVPSISIASTAASTVIEGTGANVDATFTVTRSPFSNSPLNVPFTVTAGTATVTTDFTTTSGTAAIGTGSTGTATVQIVGDAVKEPTETYTVTIAPPTTTTAVTTATATGTIQDNEATPTLSIFDNSVPEGDTGQSPITLTVTLSVANSQTVTVQYAPASATPGAGA